MHDQFMDIALRYENLITMVAASILVETFKKALPAAHKHPILRALKPMLPLIWCVLAMLLPVGLAPVEAEAG